MGRRTTRSSTRSAAQTRTDLESQTRSSSPEDQVSALENHVSKVVKTARSLRKDYVKLQQKNEELAAELVDTREQLGENAQPKRGSKGKGPNVASLQKKIVELKSRVRHLEKGRTKDRRKIANLEAKEIRRDAQELQDQTEFEVGDSVHMMRKLLRRFHDLMLANSLDDSEECSICMTAMEVGKSTSLPCQHVFCTDCIQDYISARPRTAHGGENTIPCPACREPAREDEMEVVEYTSATQWDALLEVANASAKLDRRRGDLGTSEEEEEEAAANNFIHDEQSEDARSEVINPSGNDEDEQGESSPAPAPSPSKGKQRLLRVQTPPSEPEQEPVASGSTDSTLTNLDTTDDTAEFAPPPTTPRRPAHVSPSFMQSPASEKRRRLAELADARQAKEKRRRFG